MSDGSRSPAPPGTGAASGAGWADLARELAALDGQGLRRRLREIGTSCEPEITVDGRPVANFGSNNYLGLASHPLVVQAAKAAFDRWGAGAGASRLIEGNHGEYPALEDALASFKGTEAAVVFSSGYAAAIGTIGALVGEGDVVLSDRLNHASLIDGCRLSRAKLLVYAHADTDHLSDVLERHRRTYRRALIVTDGLFSMDGDVAPLPDLLRAAVRYDARLLVDDAHATGVLGPEGRGTLDHFGLAPDDRIVQLGTLSKALGSLGGFVCGPAVLRDWLINRARTVIFSTALPAACLAAARAALEVCRREPALRERLLELARRVRTEAGALGLAVSPGESPIVPVVLGDADRTMGWTRALLDRNCFAPGVRPPTVPAGEARLRISLMANHTEEQVGRLVAGLAELRDREPG